MMYFCRLLFILFASILGLALLLPEHASAQYRRERIPPNLTSDAFPASSFTFCRVQYSSGGRGGYYNRRSWGSWATDFPDSDLNFSQRLSELTSIKVNRDEEGKIEHAVVRLTDPELFNYPFLYMLEVANMQLSLEEADQLREYLLRGGFLLVDDFWGSRAYNNFVYEIAKALPPEDYPIVDIPLEHPIFHIVFDLKEIPQIPGIGYWYRSGDTSEARNDISPGVNFRGIYDKKGRLIVVINHNSDLGDGWEEEAVNPVYFKEFSARKAYPLGINIVVYAMTH